MTFSLKSATLAQREQATSSKPLTEALLRCVSLLLILGYLSLGMSEAFAVNCAADTIPVSSCDNLSITGSNLTITVPIGATVGGGVAIYVGSVATGLNLTIATGATVGAQSFAEILNDGSINSMTNLG